MTALVPVNLDRDRSSESETLSFAITSILQNAMNATLIMVQGFEFAIACTALEV